MSKYKTREFIPNRLSVLDPRGFQNYKISTLDVYEGICTNFYLIDYPLQVKGYNILVGSHEIVETNRQTIPTVPNENGPLHEIKDRL